jgi:hypothetical protein
MSANLPERETVAIVVRLWKRCRREEGAVLGPKLFQFSGQLIAQEAELLGISQCILEKAPVDRFS